MNRFWGVGIAVLGVLLVAASPAGAGCPRDGTLPGAGPSVTTVATPAGTFYIDDRDLVDLEDDGEADSIWIYQENNGIADLQRGARNFVIDEWHAHGLPTVTVPPIGPVNVGPVTLFPMCMSSYCTWLSFPGSLEDQGMRDDCWEDAPPDRLLF